LHRILVAPMVAHDETIAVLGVANRATDYTEEDEAKLERLANGVSSVLEIKRAHAQTLGSLQRADIVIEQLVRTVVEALERHDPHTAGSSRRVAALALAIAREIDFDAQRHNALRIAALLHDVGNVVVPANVLAKPEALTSEETSLMRTHSFAGWRLLSEIDFGTPVAEIVHQHHERFDGSGYPRALKGDQLMLEAAILAVADTVEAMCARRSHREAPGIEAALEEITNGSGQRYDPHVAAACMRLFRQHGFVLPD
jgi:putative nucleotidyltransferase with HDIG domain